MKAEGLYVSWPISILFQKCYVSFTLLVNNEKQRFFIFYALSAFNKWFQNERVRKHTMLPKPNSESNVWFSLSFVARFNFVIHEKMASIHEDTAQTHKKRVLKNMGTKRKYIGNFSIWFTLLSPQALINVSVMSYVWTAPLIFTTVKLRTV